ncbi:MAG: type I phosphomannose isomerase catalytic subunit [Planctomycetota bacterium]
MTSLNYALRFSPILKKAIWGGRRLGTMLGKPIGEGEDYAESWEVVDHGADQSVVANGPLAGKTLAELVAQHPTELFGRHPGAERFPLLLKFLDCNRTLSVQVHPNDQQGALLDPPDLGKTEAWVVLAADENALIYAGLKDGVDAATLEEAVARGECDRCLHSYKPEVGDCVFIPAGTVHALGGGLVIAEIQQASDTTFRLFDWNRVGADGQPRQLHVQESLDTIDFSRGPVEKQAPKAVVDGRGRLVECDKFVLDRIRSDRPIEVGGDERFHIIVLVDGAVSFSDASGEQAFASGESLLLPATADRLSLAPGGAVELLDMYLPA